MASQQETGRDKPNPESLPGFEPKPGDVERLSQFLDDSSIVAINIKSVFPLKQNLMYLLKLARIVEKNGNLNLELFDTDSLAVGSLSQSLSGLEEKEKRQKRRIINNLDLIACFTSNPLNWDTGKELEDTKYD